MPIVVFNGKKIICKQGANLRKILIDSGNSPHNGNAKVLNCMGLGTCGTCAVKIKGNVAPMNSTEKRRLSLLPHRISHGLRLACQIRITDDLTVNKGRGFWGQFPAE